MPVATELQPILDLLAAVDAKPMHETTPAEVRAGYEQMSAMRFGDPTPVGAVAERAVPGPGGDLRLRVYTPEGTGPFPVVAYFHGGGWVIGSVETHDETCRVLCARSACVVVSADYRLAPEHPYPAAVDDALASVRWLGEHAEEVGGIPGALAVAGDSAGGNLAAVAAQRLRTEGPRLALQVLVYPVTDGTRAYPSYTENADGFFLTAESMAWFFEQYLPDSRLALDPGVAPLQAPDLSGLPPTLILTAGYDPLRDEGEAYGRALQAAGVEAEVVRYDDMIHGFYSMIGLTPRALEAHDLVADRLRAAFAARGALPE